MAFDTDSEQVAERRVARALAQGAAPAASDPVARDYARWAALQARLAARAGAMDNDKDDEPALAELIEIEHRMAQTPAASAAGLLAKLRIAEHELREYIGERGPDLNQAMILSAIEDAKRLVP